MHGSIEGNALWAMLSPGLVDERAEALAERLRYAQWPDGGRNCDRKASGRCSSFTESLIPLRALHLHAQQRADTAQPPPWRRLTNSFSGDGSTNGCGTAA